MHGVHDAELSAFQRAGEALGAPGKDAATTSEAFIQRLGLTERLSKVSVTDDKLLIGENALFSVFTRANPRPINGPHR